MLNFKKTYQLKEVMALARADSKVFCILKSDILNSAYSLH